MVTQILDYLAAGGCLAPLHSLRSESRDIGPGRGSSIRRVLDETELASAPRPAPSSMPDFLGDRAGPFS